MMTNEGVIIETGYCVVSLASRSSYCTVESHEEGEESKDTYEDHKNFAFVGTGINVVIVHVAELLSAVPHQCNRDQKQDERTANASRVCNHDLRVANDHDNGDYWECKYYRPNSLHASLVILYQKIKS